MAPCSSGCSHAHVPAQAPRAYLWLVLALVAGFSVVELVGGWWAHSLSLMADSGHLATDALSVGTMLFVLWLSRGRAEQAAQASQLEAQVALANGVVLLGLALWVGLSGLGRLVGYLPAQPVEGLPMLALAAMGLAVCLLNLALLHRDSHTSLGVRSVFAHILMDALSSLGVLVAALLVWRLGWQWADAGVGLVTATLMLPTALSLVRESQRALRLDSVQATASGSLSLPHD